MICYAGIGSRETPKSILEFFEYLGELLAKKGFTLRSGAAKGADSAFEKGCDRVSGLKEIFLPWRGFEGSKSDKYRRTNTTVSLIVVENKKDSERSQINLCDLSMKEAKRRAEEETLRFIKNYKIKN